MKSILRALCVPLLFLTLVFPAHADQAYFIQPVSETQNFRFNNENWNLVPHPEVSSFVIFPNGEMIGTTTTGVPFEQRVLENDLGIKVHKYSIQDHYHYILSDRIYFSTNNLLAYLERVRHNQNI